MKYAKLFSVLVGVLLLSYGAIGFYFLPMASFQGDLTRMGLLPEKLFGWRKPQPAIAQQWLTQASMQEADVLVFGDSFSDSRVWQSVLIQRGLKVRTESLGAVGGVCTDFVSVLRAQGFTGQYVVIETVERNFSEGLKKSVICQKTQPHFDISTVSSRPSPLTLFDTTHGNYSGKLSISIKNQLNILKYNNARKSAYYKSWVSNEDVRVVRIANGCSLFSHIFCEDSLFLAWDREEDLDDTTIKNMEKLNSRITGITPIWVVVPNKSTTYLYPSKQFWNQAEQRLHAPNLLRMTQQAIQTKTMDLYPANNTHFSTTGYLLMGEAIYQSIMKAKAARLDVN